MMYIVLYKIAQINNIPFSTNVWDLCTHFVTILNISLNWVHVSLCQGRATDKNNLYL